MGKANFGGIMKQAARTYKALEELQQLVELDVLDVDDPDASPFSESPPERVRMRPAA